jgi:hypothetical protein
VSLCRSVDAGAGRDWGLIAKVREVSQARLLNKVNIQSSFIARDTKGGLWVLEHQAEVIDDAVRERFGSCCWCSRIQMAGFANCFEMRISRH